MGYMEGSMFPKIALIVFLLLVVGVTTFYQTVLLNQEKLNGELENQTSSELENQTAEPILEQNSTQPEEESQEPEMNASEEIKEEESCSMMEDLPEDVISLNRMIANLTQENRLLNKTIENQKNYIQAYKRSKEKAERELKECLNYNGTGLSNER